MDYALASFALGLKFVYPHFLHFVAFHEFLELHFMQIFFMKTLLIASSNAIISPVSHVI